MKANVKTILVTGCNGFIGRKLTTFLLNKGINVIGIDIQDSNENNNELFSYISWDYKDSNVLYGLLKSKSIDIVYHLAWKGVSTDKKNNPAEQFANIPITYSLLELCKLLSVRKIVMPGSTSEFSKVQSKITGTGKDSPSDLYASVKAAVRRISFYYCEKNGMDLNWLLITSIYGSDRTDNNLIYSVIRSILHKKKIQCTKLEQLWDYVFVDDVIQAMYVVGLFGKKGLIYPVGSGDSRPLSKYVKIITDYLCGEEFVEIGALPYKNKHIDNSIPDISKLKSIGYKSQHCFDEEIKTIINKIKETNTNV